MKLIGWSMSETREEAEAVRISLQKNDRSERIFEVRDISRLKLAKGHFKFGVYMEAANG